MIRLLSVNVREIRRYYTRNMRKCRVSLVFSSDIFFSKPFRLLDYNDVLSDDVVYCVLSGDVVI